MSPGRQSSEMEAHFQTKYSQSCSQAERLLEERALGHAVGLHGYTTLAQAQALAETLELRSQELLLDLGAGRGWPGVHIAQSSDCHLIALDLPYDALRAAREKMRPRAGRICAALVADGGAIPLKAASVDAIVHADAF